ncbi:hypothetical protein J2Z22_000662 [Paenibacillus forsythiae]|uniref:Uncharacterized protein n=1 Tax=Paenibacillus forsythiae TaxID=365616 RepID=A0ABU3H2U7_9BACL|nr:hypothetical protein [Paenibacillus forsythiae]MDT3425149.1 hypothetical protein [Paenibacillus forsythiae]
MKGLGLATLQFKWTVKELAPNHGLGVDAGSLKFHADGTFSIEVKNAYLRSLGAFAQFFNEKGEQIKNPAGWEEKLPEFMRSWFETDSKKFITPVSAVNSEMGMPMPTVS